MKNLFKFFGIIALVALIMFSIGSCDNGNGNSGDGGNGNPFVGTWVGTVMGAQATVVISAGNTWSLNVPDLGFSDSGSYSGAGSVATLNSNNIGGGVVVTATAIINVDGSVTTINLVLNQNSAAPGTYTLTKL